MGSAISDRAVRVVVANDAICRLAVGLDGGFIGGGTADSIGVAASEKQAAAQDGAEQQ